MNKFRLLVFAGLLCCTSVARAGELYIFEHNRSVVSWFFAGGSIEARYDQPRSGMAEAGVKEGTILFKGQEEAGKIVGTAYTFRRGCPPAPFQVIGDWEGDWITLRGPAPIWSKRGCGIVGYTLDSPHANLRFRYSSTHH